MSGPMSTTIWSFGTSSIANGLRPRPMVDLGRDHGIGRKHEPRPACGAPRPGCARRCRADPPRPGSCRERDPSPPGMCSPSRRRPAPPGSAQQRVETSSLPETLAPPMIARNGCAGRCSRPDSASTSRSMSRPGDGRKVVRDPLGRACARWAAPKASLTYRSARPASAAAKSGIVRLLRGMEANVLEQDDVAGRSLSTADLHARARARRRSCAPAARGARLSRSATGRRRSASFTLPFGRPRCARARPRPARGGDDRRQAARMRVSSAIRPSSSGTLKSARTKTSFPDVDVADRLELHRQRGRAARP